MGLSEAITWLKWISHLSNIKGSSFPEHLTKGFGLLTKRATQVERNIQKAGHDAKPSSELEASAPCVKIQNSKRSFIWKINTHKKKALSRLLTKKQSYINTYRVLVFGQCPTEIREASWPEDLLISQFLRTKKSFLKIFAWSPKAKPATKHKAMLPCVALLFTYSHQD